MADYRSREKRLMKDGDYKMAETRWRTVEIALGKR